MGARLARVLRNVNLENRVMREISRDKPAAAPRHPGAEGPPAAAADLTEAVHQKSDPLLSLLKTVYVQSKDPPPAEAAEQAAQQQQQEEEQRRTLKYSLAGSSYGLADLTDVPKGKLSLVEALKALGSHKEQPGAWPAERLAEEYSLAPHDAKAMLEFFIPFNVKVVTPEAGGGVKQIKDS